MDPFEFADIAVGMLHRESETGSSEERTAVGIPQKVSGFAETDSADGYVYVDLGGSSVTEDGWQAVEMPCDISVKAGDEVSVEIVDGKPRVVGRIGWGDALQTIADDAYSVATATNQHFWADANGAHVSTDANDPEGASNSLWNSLGLLIRKATNYLVSITSSAIAFYDGLGNAASNIVASFGSSGATIGKTANEHIVIGSGGVEVFTDSSTSVAEFGSTSRVGTATDGHVELTSSSIDFYDGAARLAAIDTSYGGYPTMWLGTHDFRLAKYESTSGGETTDVLSIDSLSASPNEGEVEMLANGKSGTAALMVSSEDGTGGNFYIGPSKTTAMDDFDVLGNITTTGTSTASAHNGWRGRVLLASTDNIDTLYRSGVYYISSAGVGGTMPSGFSAYFSLISMGSADETSAIWVGKQLAVSANAIAWRSYAGSPRTWSAWKIVTGNGATQTSTAADIISPASGVTVSAAYYTYADSVGQLYVTFTRSSPIGTTQEITIGTVLSGKRPKQQCFGGFTTANSVYGNARVLASGDVRVRPTETIASNTSVTVIFPAYILA